MASTEEALVLQLPEDLKPMIPGSAPFKAIVQADSGTEMPPLPLECSRFKIGLERATPAGIRILPTGEDKEGQMLRTLVVGD